MVLNIIPSNTGIKHQQRIYNKCNKSINICTKSIQVPYWILYNFLAFTVVI